MTHEKRPCEPIFGYLSAWESPELGCLGGYLIVSVRGRPLEFHCAAPVPLNRAQQILFGPTLWPYVLGEQIGGRLLREAKLRPSVVLTDHPATLCLRSQIHMPMVRVLRRVQEADQGSETHLRNRDSIGQPSCGVVLSDCSLELPSGFESDHAAAVKALEQLAQHIDLWEPFDRIQEAIREAQRLDGRSHDGHEQAA
jgi:hypothetical protein